MSRFILFNNPSRKSVISLEKFRTILINRKINNFCDPRNIKNLIVRPQKKFILMSFYLHLKLLMDLN
jgi:hypothetical protein